MRILQQAQTVAAFGVGGYAAGPMMLATWMRGTAQRDLRAQRRAGIHEPSALARYFETHRRRLRTLRQSARDRKPSSPAARCAPDFSRLRRALLRKPLRLLVTGGSQGARHQSRVRGCDGPLAVRKNELSIVHQTGERDYNAVRAAYARREFAAEVVPFFNNMAERFAWADVIVCRAGAITACGNRRRRPRRYLHPLWRRDRQPSIAQRAGDGQRRRRTRDSGAGAERRPALRVKFSRCSTSPGRSKNDDARARTCAAKRRARHRGSDRKVAGGMSVKATRQQAAGTRAGETIRAGSADLGTSQEVSDDGVLSAISSGFIWWASAESA